MPVPTRQSTATISLIMIATAKAIDITLSHKYHINPEANAEFGE
jgi:hypothetical protein